MSACAKMVWISRWYSSTVLSASLRSSLVIVKISSGSMSKAWAISLALLAEMVLPMTAVPTVTGLTPLRLDTSAREMWRSLSSAAMLILAVALPSLSLSFGCRNAE